MDPCPSSGSTPCIMPILRMQIFCQSWHAFSQNVTTFLHHHETNIVHSYSKAAISYLKTGSYCPRQLRSGILEFKEVEVLNLKTGERKRWTDKESTLVVVFGASFCSNAVLS